MQAVQQTSQRIAGAAWRRVTPLRALVAVQLLVIAVTGVATVARFPVPALVDEAAHYDYVHKLAEERRLPVLGEDLVAADTAALGGASGGAPVRDGHALEEFSYEAFQPPLYYVLAAPAPALAPGGPVAQVRVLRVAGLALLALACWLLWPLARRVSAAVRPAADPLALYSLALTVLMWPGVVVRSVTVSNAALELPLGIAVAIALWDAHARRDPRRLVLAGALLGAGLLTRLTLVAFVPVLAGVAFVVAGAVPAGARRRRVLAAVALALALPALVLAPWIASNVGRYGAPTASAQVRELQEPVLNPAGERYGIGDLLERAPALAQGPLAEEWWAEFLEPRNRRLRDLFAILYFALPLVGIALLGRGARARATGLLGAPLLGGLAWIAYAMLAGNWDFVLPRYLHPELAVFGLLAALGWRRLAGGDRGLAVVAAGWSGVFAALWLGLATVTPFAP